jgi:hypothetical protein
MIVLKLTRIKKHCIETAAKKEYERLVLDCLKKKSATRLRVVEAQMNGLKYFLENADFAKLRHRYTELRGNAEQPVMLKIPEDYRGLTIMIDEREIKPEWKQPQIG